MSYTKNKFETFCKKIQIKYPDEDLTVISYDNAKAPATIRCNTCGTEYTIKYAEHFMDKEKQKVCSKCIPRRDTREVGKKVENILKDNKNITLLNTYTKITDDLILKCNHCQNVFKRKPQVFLKSQKCPCCETKVRFKTKQAFELELKEKFGNEYELLGDYTGTRERTLFRHNDCGFIFETTPHNLLTKTPCPKCKKFNSKGEIAIKKILTQHDILFVTQKRFPDLSNLLSFDFYIPANNLLIEFQGEQHYHAIPHFGGEEKYEKQVKNDELKKEYCKKKGITLLEIKYDEIDKIETILSFLWLNDQSKDVASSEAK